MNYPQKPNESAFYCNFYTLFQKKVADLDKNCTWGLFFGIIFEFQITHFSKGFEMKPILICIICLITPFWGFAAIEELPAPFADFIEPLNAYDPILRRDNVKILGEIAIQQDIPVAMIPHIAELLHDDYASVRANTVWALGAIARHHRLSDSIIQSIVAQLKDIDTSLQIATIKALWWIALSQQLDSATLHALAELLRSPSARVRREVALALGRISHSQTIDETIIQKLPLEDKDHKVRVAIAWLLGEISQYQTLDKAVLERFGKRLYDEESVVRITTIDTLEKMHLDHNSYPFIAKQLEKVAKEDTDKEVREHATKALKTIKTS